MAHKNWKTRLAIPAVMLGCLGAGYVSSKAEDYLDWRKERINAIAVFNRDGLIDKIVREFNAISEYRHRNDAVLSPEENEADNRVEKIEEESREINPYVHLI